MASNTHTPVAPPKAVTAFEFEARCADLVEEVRRIRRPLLITRRGKPVAQLSPYPYGRKVRGKKAIHTLRRNREWAWGSTPADETHGIENEKPTSTDLVQSQAPAPIPHPHAIGLNGHSAKAATHQTCLKRQLHRTLAKKC